MDNIKAVCNWTRIGGCEWEKAVQAEFVEEEIVKPEINDILHEDRAVLLRRKMHVEGEGESESCELQLKVFPRYKIAGLTILCTVPKIEVFVGVQDEYYETEHGCPIDEENSNIGELRNFRYDIEIQKSGISELILKLLTNSDEICIFAILVHIAPNPNGITTLMSTGINIENVEKMLEGSSQKLTPNAEKCKKLLQMCGKAPLSATTSSDVLKQDVACAQLQVYIEKRLDELESKMLKRLNVIEAQQTSKLDEILKELKGLKGN